MNCDGTIEGDRLILTNMDEGRADADPKILDLRSADDMKRIASVSILEKYSGPSGISMIVANDIGENGYCFARTRNPSEILRYIGDFVDIEILHIDMPTRILDTEWQGYRGLSNTFLNAAINNLEASGEKLINFFPCDGGIWGWNRDRDDPGLTFYKRKILLNPRTIRSIEDKGNHREIILDERFWPEHVILTPVIEPELRYRLIMEPASKMVRAARAALEQGALAPALGCNK